MYPQMYPPALYNRLIDFFKKKLLDYETSSTIIIGKLPSFDTTRLSVLVKTLSTRQFNLKRQSVNGKYALETFKATFYSSSQLFKFIHVTSGEITVYNVFFSVYEVKLNYLSCHLN